MPAHLCRRYPMRTDNQLRFVQQTDQTSATAVAEHYALALDFLSQNGQLTSVILSCRGISPVDLI